MSLVPVFSSPSSSLPVLVDKSQPDCRQSSRGDQHEHVLDDEEHAERVRRSVWRVDLGAETTANRIIEVCSVLLISPGVELRSAYDFEPEKDKARA
jgi:hypothetical protein